MNLKTIGYWLGLLIVVHLGATWLHAAYGEENASEGRCLREPAFSETGLQGKNPVFEELVGLNQDECASAGGFFIPGSSETAAQ